LVICETTAVDRCIRPGATRKVVVTFSAVEQVISVTAAEVVHAFAAVELVVAAETTNGIVRDGA
jgi:hypothetical protein